MSKYLLFFLLCLQAEAMVFFLQSPNPTWPVSAVGGDTVATTNDCTGALTITTGGSPGNPITLIVTNGFKAPAWDTSGAININFNTSLWTGWAKVTSPTRRTARDWPLGRTDQSASSAPARMSSSATSASPTCMLG